MSAEVDNRIVEMRFDNAQFEKGVSESMSTLDKLKAALKFDGVTNIFKKISDAAKNCSINALGLSVEGITSKFTDLEIVSQQVIRNITTDVQNTVKNFIKSVSVDQLAAGWSKFEEITNSSGTLVAQGFLNSQVEDVLNQLNWFTDETSYNLADMVSNIGKFTASGLELEESATAMEGIATWAALSGQNATKASSAMYQLSQAVSKGALKYDDWKSIQNAGMDTQEFRENAAEAAVAVGALTKAGEDMYTTLSGKTVSLNDLFSSDYMSREAWFTKDAMMEVFNQYSAAVDGIYEITEQTFSNKQGEQIKLYATEVLEARDAFEESGDAFKEYCDNLNLSDEAAESLQTLVEGIDEFGLKAFKAAQEARSWTDVVSSVKDAVSTGWMNTYKLIVGDYEQAKELFSSLAGTLYDAFAEGGNRRNEILSTWNELGGRDDLLELFNGLVDLFTTTRDTVKNWWHEVFPEKTAYEAGEHLYETIKKFKEFIQTLKISDRALYNFKSIVEAVSMTAKTFKQALSYALNTIFGFKSSANSLGGVLLEIVGIVARVITAFNKWLQSSKLIQTVLIVLSKVAQTINIVFAVVFTLFSEGLSKIQSCTKKVNNNQKKTSIWVTVLNNIKKALKAIGTAALVAVRAIAEFISLVANSSIVKNIKTGFIKAISTIGNALKNLYGTLLAKTGNIFKNFLSQAQELGKYGIDGLFRLVTLAFSGLFEFVTTVISNFISLIREKLKGTKFEKILNIILDKLKLLAPLFKTLGESIKNFLSNLSLGKIAAFAFVLVLVMLMNALTDATNKFGNMTSSITNFVNKTSMMTQLTNVVKKNPAFLQFAEAIGIMAASILLLKNIPAKQLKAIVLAIASLAAIMTVATVAISLLQKAFTKFAKTKDKIDFQSVGLDYLALAGAVLMIALALKKVEAFHFDTTGAKIATIGLIMLELGIVATIVGKFQNGGSFKGSLTIIALGLSLKLILESLSNLNQFNYSQLMDSLVKIGVVLAAFGAMLAGLGTVGIGGGLTLITIAGILALFKKNIISVLEGVTGKLNALAPKLSKFIDSLDLTESALLGVIAVASIAAVGLSAITKNFKGLAKSILSFGIFIGILAGAAMLVAKLADSGVDVGQGFLPITIFLGGLIGILFLLRKVSSEYSEKTIKEVRKLMTSLALVISEMVMLSYLIEGAKPESLLKLGGIAVGLTVAVGVLVAVQKLSNKIAGANAHNGGSLTPILIMLGIVYGAIVVLATMINNGMTVEVIGATVVALGALLGLAFSLKILFETMKDAKIGSLAILIAAMTGCIGALCALAMSLKRYNVSWKAMGQLGALSGGVIALGALSVLLSTLGKKIPISGLGKILLGIGIMSLAIRVLTGLVNTINKVASTWKITASKIGSMSAVLGVLSGFVVAFGALGVLMVSYPIILVGALAGIALMELAIWALSGLLKSISDCSVTASMSGSVAAILGILTGFGLIFAALGLISPLIAAASLAMRLMVWVISSLANAINLMVDVAEKAKSIDANAFAQTLIVLGNAILAFSKNVAASAVLLASGLVIFTAITAITAIFTPVLLVAAVGFAAVGASLKALAAGIIEVKNAASGFFDIIGNIFNLAKEDGAYVAQGYAEGIGSDESKSLVEAAVSGLASICRTVWRTLLRIESPSRVATEDGAYVAQGYAIGIGNTVAKALVSKAAAGLVTETEQQLQEMPAKAEEIGSETTDCLAQDWDKVPDTIKQSINAARGNMTSLEYTTIESSSNMKTAIVNTVTKIRDCFAQTLGENNKLVQGLNMVVTAAKNTNVSLTGLFDVTDKGTDIVSGIAEQIKEATGLSEDGTSVYEEYANSISNVGSSATETKSALEEMSDSLADSLDLFSEFSAGDEITPDQMLSNMNSQISAIANWGNMMALLAARGMDQGLLQELGELGTAGYTKVQAFVNMTDEQLAQANALYAQSLVFPEYVANEVQSSYAYAGEMASRGFSNALDATLAIVPAQQLGNTAVETLKNVLGIHSPSTVMYDIGSNCIAGFRNALKDGHDSIRTFVELLCAMIKLKLSFGLRYQVGYDIGNNLISGLHDGIVENRSRAIDAAAWVAAQAYAAACNTLGVESPSKKFYEIGMYTDMGFANGISKYSNLVTNASGGLGESAVNSVRSAIQKVSAVINSDIDTSPTIRPVLDLSSVRAGAQEIGSMFNNNKYGASINTDASGNQNKGGSSSGMTFVQNNYSPKALSREEIYRQTRNQFSALKGQIAHA